MLELKNITKEYPAGDGKVQALKGIDLTFGKSEFVSVLGPSGCGKTTMLNIIGGLDKYTTGDLVINGRSTKDFKDRDWDAYRNHSIGFVFQTYNLIPHQSVLQNVELALTLSGVSKTERRKRAKEALEKVGLGDQLKKKPGEMSGGQVQRVAIARAIVNNPDIILADEPTGALDTETSIQVLDILKEIANDRLVIMVTHNPDLANRYSTRIVNMLDGEITADSKPFTDEEKERELKEALEKAESDKGKKKPSMSFRTSFGLSLKNLFTKRGRTILTSFAGSIGIIGIALIFSVSKGMTTYIDEVQEETLSSYPITLEEQHIDLSSLMQSFMDLQEGGTVDHGKDAVYEKSILNRLMNTFNSLDADTNELDSFKHFIEDREANDEQIDRAINGVSYTYALNMPIYTKNTDGEVIESDSTKLMQQFIAESLGSSDSPFTMMERATQTNNPLSTLMRQGSSYRQMWQQMLPGEDGQPINDLIKSQYDLVYGTWPEKYDEIVLRVDKNNEIDDIVLYALGLVPKENIKSIIDASSNGEVLNIEKEKFSYEDVCNSEFVTFLPSDCYVYDEQEGVYKDLRETEAGLNYLYANGLKLKITGIIRQNEDAIAGMITGSIGYTFDLTKYIIEESKNSDAVKAQLDAKDRDVFTNKSFRESAKDYSFAEKAKLFKSYIENLDVAGLASTYIKMMSIPTDDQLSAMTD
ncbi:MAG: ABC transporter ATP-binding protein, partial [Lachnospiraceae bacterium]|nr:ABC transporter ATP-binding protein [Lachnospiraceae bacterium]